MTRRTYLLIYLFDITVLYTTKLHEGFTHFFNKMILIFGEGLQI